MAMPPSGPPLRTQAAALALSLGVSAGVAAIGAIASVQARSFYAELVRPDWAPPGWLFGPMWSLLYTLMAVSAWLVWRSAGLEAARRALALYGVQLAVNAAWSWCFFAWRQGALALADVVLLWLLIVATMAAFWRLHRLAALLLVPYLAWVSLATALTWAVWRANPQLLGGMAG